jgi:N-methylhydantoinase A
MPSNGSRPAGKPSGSREVYFHGHDLTDTPIYRREELPAGFSAAGPMIVEEVSSTTVVHPGQTLNMHPSGLMTIDL